MAQTQTQTLTTFIANATVIVTATTRPTRITLATIKAFVRRNTSSLYVQQRSRFDAMEDGVRNTPNPTFRLVPPTSIDMKNEQTLGIEGAWFVRDSRDCFEPFSMDGFTGYRVYNCCGSFLLAVPAITGVVAA